MTAAVLARLDRIPFWFLRHGETDWNARNLSQGNVEIPLNEHGLAQARAAAELLPNRGIATIVSSPLSRARITADVAAAKLGLPVLVDEGLREVCFGVNEAKPMSEPWFADWVYGRSTPEGAESFGSLRERAVAAVNRALTHPPSVLVVAHGALFRAVRAAMGIEPNVRTPNAIPVLCEPPPEEGGVWTLTMAQ